MSGGKSSEPDRDRDKSTSSYISKWLSVQQSAFFEPAGSCLYDGRDRSGVQDDVRDFDVG